MNEQQIKELSRDLCRIVGDYLKNEAYRKAFEDWYFKKYGKPYVWKGAKQ